MFQIKICGITTVEDALLAAEAGADAIGLNFYEKSPRYVTLEQAKEITGAIQNCRRPPRVVGVFVNQSTEKMCEIALRAEFASIQLHGDESPSDVVDFNILNSLGSKSWLEKLLLPDPMVLIIRAFRNREETLLPISDYLRACRDLKYADDAKLMPQAILLDAYQPDSFGGTGKRLDWDMVRAEREMLFGLPLILAGGLTPENVAEAIATARPDAVDVASGVESAPGKKDPAKVRAFVAAAKEAFATRSTASSPTNRREIRLGFCG
jgi:phosphoribosylanthranilate isomerase